MRRILFILSVTAIAGSAAGQSMGSDVPRSRVVPVREQVESQLADSMIRLGALRVQPDLQLRNFGYYENVFADAEGNEIDDFGGSVAAGVELLLPMGKKVFLRGVAMPQYTYFVDVEELRRFSGSYGGEILTLWNQLAIQAGGLTTETLSSVSSEIEAPAIADTERIYGNFELELARRFSLYAGAQTSSQLFEEEDGIDVGEVERLDRDETLLQGGFRYDFRSYFQISTLYEITETEYEIDPFRDYETSAILLGVHYDLPRFYVNLSAGPREIEPSTPGAFDSYSTVTGSAYVAYELGAPAVISFYGNRSLRASAFDSNALYIDDRVGSQIETKLGERASFRIGAAVGENDYPLDEAPDRPRRLDDVEELNAGLSWRLVRNFWLSIDASQIEYDSNIDNHDRDLLRVTTTITFR